MSSTEPIIALDEGGEASVVNYQLPEPTSYRLNSVISFEFDKDYFNDPYGSATKEVKHLDYNQLREAVNDYKIGTITHTQLVRRTDGMMKVPRPNFDVAPGEVV